MDQVKWRQLLHLSSLEVSPDVLFSAVDLNPHPDEPQVALDIDRLFTALSFHPQISSQPLEGNMSYTTIWLPQEVAQLRKRLKTLVYSILRHHPCLNYYQGYHDIASVVLLVCPEETSDAFDVLQKLTTNYLRDFMVKDITLTMCHLRLITAVLEVADPELFLAVVLLAKYDFFPALSLVITLYSHDIANVHDILKVWYFILERHTVAAAGSIYVAALIRHRLRFIGEDDSDIVHSLASPTKLFAGMTSGDWDELLEQAAAIHEKYPFSQLPTGTYDVWFTKYNPHLAMCHEIAVGDLDATMAIQEEEVADLVIYDKEVSSLPSSMTLLTLTLIPLVFINKFDSVKHVSSIYKIGFTVGFIGVLVHLLLKLLHLHDRVWEWAELYVLQLFQIPKWTPGPLMMNGVGLGPGRW